MMNVTVGFGVEIALALSQALSMAANIEMSQLVLPGVIKHALDLPQL
jgi:hypothetical protein